MNRPRPARFLAAGLLLLWGAALAGCALRPASRGASTLDRILASRVLRVGLNPGYAPFEMIDRAGAVIGFDVDAAEVLARQLGEGVCVEIVRNDWDPIIANSNAGKSDLILSGMTGTPQRALRCAFTVPYFTTGQALLVNRSQRSP